MKNVNTPDAPYFYSERANIGVLSAAAWRAGWVSLEEFNIKKHLTKRGRCDLWFWPLDKNEEEDEYVEAKLEWKFGKVSNMLDKAKEDVKKLRLSNNYKHLLIGLVFYCPMIKRQPKINIDSKINEIINLKKSIDWDVVAWSFPKESRGLRIGAFYYPGIVLFAKIAESKKKI